MSQKHEVLLVDGDGELRSNIEQALKDIGMHPSSVNTGGEALLRSWARHIDLIIADLQHPEGKCLEMLNMAKTSVPSIAFFILIKGSGANSGVDCSVADVVFTAPIDPWEVAATAYLVCKRRERERGFQH